MEQALTIWVDESTELAIGDDSYNLVGYLITNSDAQEFEFLNKLKQARKKTPSCWRCLHGSDLREDDDRALGLLDKWLDVFSEDDSVYYHAFLYRRNENYIPAGQTYEHYFAKQSLFALANKMKKRGYPVNTMFKDVATLTILFDRRRAHAAGMVTRDDGETEIERFHELENVYKQEIGQQISNVSGKDITTNELTVRFSFLSSECFDGMQFTDCFLYLIRKKIEQEEEDGAGNVFTELFDRYVLEGLDQHTRDLGFRKIYEYSKKFNFFESTA